MQFEMNGVQGKVTAREQCSILHVGKPAARNAGATLKSPNAVHRKMQEFRDESAREIPIIATP